MNNQQMLTLCWDDLDDTDQNFILQHSDLALALFVTLGDKCVELFAVEQDVHVVTEI